MIAFLGAGKLAEAIIRGGLSAGSLRTDQLLVSARSPERRAALAQMGWEVLTGLERLRDAELVILGVRHRDMPALLTEVAPALEGKLVLSLALGVTTRHLEGALPRSRIIRAIPNAPARVREAVTLMARGQSATTEDLSRASALFTPLGRILELPESQLDTAHAVSGAGPAYALAFVEALTRAAEAEGLPAELAREAVRQTVFGAARMLRAGPNTEAMLEELAVPGGSTRAGLDVLARANLEALFREAIASGRARAEARNLESDQSFQAWLGKR
ncbi:MAG: pyrroline-5-carboxylate reductase family protein [Myxococcota bacterium]